MELARTAYDWLDDNMPENDLPPFWSLAWEEEDDRWINGPSVSTPRPAPPFPLVRPCHSRALHLRPALPPLPCSTVCGASVLRVLRACCAQLLHLTALTGLKHLQLSVGCSARSKVRAGALPFPLPSLTAGSIRQEGRVLTCAMQPTCCRRFAPLRVSRRWCRG